MLPRRPSRRLIQAVLFAAVSGCAAQPPPSPASPPPSSTSPTTTELKKEVEALRADVDKLAARLEKLEKAPAPPAWSCAAYCLTSYHCESNGNSSVKWKDKTATGVTAAEAFAELTKSCDDLLYVDGKCTNGAFVRTQATMQNACVRN
ncbi:MAG: hypothetical protein JNL79_28715 [Myxococcales bacterium]|nr:hypothetical protein [Myxococcales bacterium]